MDTVEKFCIFEESMNIYQLKQKYKVQRNNISETILQGEGLWRKTYSLLSCLSSPCQTRRLGLRAQRV
jgi:hypothetical protein